MSGPSVFRALRHRNFRLFFFGQMLSVAGTHMQRVALGWLAYRLTGSASFLGLVTFVGSAPVFLLSPVAGVLADRVSRHRILVVAQALSLVQAAALAALTLAGRATPAWLVILTLVLGILNTFENPARQSFYTEMVDQEDLANAIALNSSQVNVAAVVGPAVAGVIVAVWGEGVCFAINALSFLAVIVALLMMRVESRPLPSASRPHLELLREGFQFIRGNPAMRATLSNFAILNLAGSPYLTLLPILAGAVLKVGPTGLGWLVSLSGLGAISSSLLLATRTSTRGLPGASFAASMISAAGMMILGASRILPASMGAMLLIGGGYVFALASTQTLLQSWVSEEMRGRVMSFYSLIFLGMRPVGGLLAGLAADKIGASMTIAVGGGICMLGALYFARRPELDQQQPSLG